MENKLYKDLLKAEAEIKRLKKMPQHLFLIKAWCDQPDTRVDAGAEIHESIAIWDREPTDDEQADLLRLFLRNKDEEENDNGWDITVEKLPFFRKT